MTDAHENIASLASITGLPEPEAAVLLEIAGGNVERAVTLHFDGEAAVLDQDAAIAAAAAAGYDDDRGGYDDDEGEFDVNSDEDDVNGGAHAGGGGAGGEIRRARSPVGGAPAHRGNNGPPPRSRWRAVVGWMSMYMPTSLGFMSRVGRAIYGSGLFGFFASLFWAPLALLGLVSVGPRRDETPAVVVRQFEEWFEGQCGRTHPTFFRGSCQQALSRSKTDAKFVLAYVHDASAAACVRFCEQVLTSALVAAYAEEHFVLWVGDAETQEGRAVRRALRANDQPSVVVLAHGDMAAGIGGAGARGHGGGGVAPVQALGTVEEPPASPDATRLVIRLPDGRRLDRRFGKSDTLQAAIDLVESEDPDGDDVDLVSNYPRKVFKRAQRGETFEALGLHPQAMLFTQEADDDDDE